ncbi:His-Xaa-Ser system radical SAM maturase HxsC [Spongiibacter tropicus]|uniref:His-Xaa-Ser system radical SAM maturase HxsC n=1 Tax=Spongiibacter tropicus TaxID=454602 RepID=UPI0035BE10D7
MPEVIRKDQFLITSDKLTPGFVILRKDKAKDTSPFLDQLVLTRTPALSSLGVGIQTLCDPAIYDAIDDGDIGFLGLKGNLRVTLSQRANHNTVLVTERCDNRCLFCSQPPKENNDDWLLLQSAMAIAAFNTTSTVGVSGGEPLLYRETFLRFIDFVKGHTPHTPLHVLTNGRAFADADFTKAVAQRCEGLHLVFGIPLYASNAEIHDHLVGAKGAFADTMLGLINAGNSGIPIELRFIPTTSNRFQLASTVELAARCFSSITQISVMNLEPTGWAKKNWHALYIDPSMYSAELENGLEAGLAGGLPVVLFNYPLCHLTPKLRSHAVKSISDWKNYYPDECTECIEISRCSGYFSSSKGKLHSPPRRIR